MTTRTLTSPLHAGEVNITRGCARTGIIQMVSSNASLSFAQIAEARVHPDQALFFQLYKHTDNKIAEQRVREVVDLGYKAIFLTVDAIVAGNRERDIRAPFVLEEQEREANKPEERTGGGKAAADAPAKTEDGENVNLLGTAGALIANDDLDMTWEKTIPWLRSITKLPIVIKGIQSVHVCVTRTHQYVPTERTYCRMRCLPLRPASMASCFRTMAGDSWSCKC